MILFVFDLDMSPQHILYRTFISALPTVEELLNIMNTSDMRHQL